MNVMLTKLVVGVLLFLIVALSHISQGKLFVIFENNTKRGKLYL